MTIEKLEEEALRLTPTARARLAQRLLASLEQLTPDENEQLWAAEAERRDVDSSAESSRPAADVFADARARAK
jgi:hypothetical protein